MNILINGEAVELSGGISLTKWVEEQNILKDTVIVEYNGEIIPEERWDHVILKQGDQLEIFKFVGGG
jgi:sulfur carrier protein